MGSWERQNGKHLKREGVRSSKILTRISRYEELRVCVCVRVVVVVVVVVVVTDEDNTGFHEPVPYKRLS